MSRNLDEFTQSYVEALLWSETDDDGDNYDKNYDIRHIDEESLKGIIEECKLFQLENWDRIQSNLSMAGHDFMMTRQGHGVGFWEKGDWPEEDGEILTQKCKEHGETNTYVENDVIYVQSYWLDRHREELKQATYPPINKARIIDLGDL